MKRQNGESMIEALGAILIVLLLGWFIVVGAVSVATENKCLELSYAESKTTMTLEQYCIKRDYQGAMFSVPLQNATQQR